MSAHFTDVRSNPQDQIAHAARVIGGSARCRKVFSAIYHGKKKIKTVTEVMKIAGLSRMAVLQEAGKLSNNKIIKKTKIAKELAYEKDSFFTQNKKTILRLAGNRKAMSKFPTKTNPKIEDILISVYLPKKMIDARHITIDDIDSCEKVRDNVANHKSSPIDEEEFQQGLQRIIGEDGVFQDWGGETDDLFSTQLIIDGKRRATAFAFKGKGTRGILTPKKLGKRGDQIQRLFRAPAEVFIVQYWGQIDESVIEQMKNFAIAKSVLEEKRIYYGIIDGKDTMKIITSYPMHFNQTNG